MEIKRHHPHFDETKIDKRKIFKKLYKEKEYNDGLIRRMTSDLINLAEEFLMIKSFENTKMFRDSCLLHELRMRELNKIFELKSDKIMNQIVKQNIQNNSSLHKFFVENQLIGYMLKHREKDLPETVFSASDSLISFFLSSMNNKSQLINRNKLKKLNASILFDKFQNYFDYKKFIISLDKINNGYSRFIKTDYYLNRITADKNDEEGYFKLKEIMNSDSDYLYGVHKYNYYITLTKFCSYQIENHNYKYLKEYFDNIEPVLKEKLFLANSNLLHISIIRNIIRYSAKLKSYSYTDNFLKTYSKYFRPDIKDMLINYYSSLIFFERKKYEDALNCLTDLNFDELDFKIDLKILKIKIFYELHYPDSVFSETDALRHFLSNNRVSENTLISVKNFLKYITGIMNAKNKDDLMLLKNQIEKEKLINDKDWLIDKIMNYKF